MSYVNLNKLVASGYTASDLLRAHAEQSSNPAERTVCNMLVHLGSIKGAILDAEVTSDRSYTARIQLRDGIAENVMDYIADVLKQMQDLCADAGLQFTLYNDEEGKLLGAVIDSGDISTQPKQGGNMSYVNLNKIAQRTPDKAIKSMKTHYRTAKEDFKDLKGYIESGNFDQVASCASSICSHIESISSIAKAPKSEEE